MAKIHEEDESRGHLRQWLQNRRELLKIEARHQQMLSRVVKIQTFYRGHIARKILKKARRKALYLQRIMKGIYVRNLICKQQLARLKLQRFAKVYLAMSKLRKAIKAVDKIKAFYKMRKQRRKYLAIIAERKNKTKLSLIEQRKRMLLNKQKWRASVIIIERERYKQLHRRECRLLRKYLAKLPYECRGLYFKFIDIKKRTHNLVINFVQYMEDAHNVQTGETFDLKYD